MPRTPEQLEQVRETSRARILDAALALFARHGHAGTSVRMIAEAAGISQGLLYNYFAGKEALLEAIFERSMADVAESFERAAAAATPEARIERLVHAALEIVADHLEFWRLTYQVRMQSGVLEGLGDRVGAWSEGVRRHLEGLLREAGVASAEVEGRLLFAAIDGVAQHYALDPDGYPVGEVAEALVRHMVPSGGRRPHNQEEEGQ